MTIKSLTNGLAPTISNQGTVSGSNFANVLTDDPAAGGAADPTTTTLDSLTLGNQIWIETDSNSAFNSGTDTGANAVALTLFLSDGTTVVTTGSTNGSGEYQFTGCCPAITSSADASNFGAAQPLDGNLDHRWPRPGRQRRQRRQRRRQRRPRHQRHPQPGDHAGHNTEITAGIGNDTNNTLDFGFATNDPPVLTTTGSITYTENDARDGHQCWNHGHGRGRCHAGPVPP